MFVTTVALVVATFIFLWWLLKPSRYHQLLAKIPGPTPIPIFGNALQLKTDVEGYFEQVKTLCDKYQEISPVFKLLLGNQALVYIFQASSAEQFLGSTKNISKALPYQFLHPWLQTGLLTSTGEKWHTRRKVLTPTFHFKILADFLEIFNEQANFLVKVLGEKCDKGPFDVFPLITLYTLDVICETAMGTKMGAQKMGGNSEYVKAVQTLSESVMVRFRSPWQWIDFIYNRTPRGRKYTACLQILHTFTKKMINQRIQDIEENKESFSEDQRVADNETGLTKKQRLAFLDLLIHMSKEADFTRNDIQEEVDTFMFGGHDTTAAAMVWAIQLIGSHPDVQRKVHDEMDDIFGESDRPATMADISKMKYLECVIKETLRLFPPVPQIGRFLEEDIEIDGVQIPKGVSLAICIWKINRDPRWYKNPQEFDPERFTTENSVGKNPYAFIPFSGGPRNCIGQRFALIETKCVLSTILRKYNIESTQTIEEIRPIPDIVLRPMNGLKIKLTKCTE